VKAQSNGRRKYEISENVNEEKYLSKYQAKKKGSESLSAKAKISMS